MGEIERASALAAAGARVTQTALKIPAGTSWEKYEDMAVFVGSIGAAYPWWVGDLLNSAEDEFGEEHAQIEAFLPHSPQTCANYKSVASRIPENRRRTRKDGTPVPYSIHAEVAYLEPRDRERLLDQAVREGWKREEMRSARRALSPPEDLPAEAGPKCPNCGHPL